MQRVAAIMAGGRGERLWPRSRTRLPKQFLSLGGTHQTFLQQTYGRVAGMASAPEVVVLTAGATVPLVRAQIPGLAADHLLGEPVPRDTAAAATLALATARAVAGGECLLALVPADHACFDVAGFREALRTAWDQAEAAGCPVLIGIPPTRPETGYGYILRGDALAPAGAGPGGRVVAVERFVEKPSLERAAEYLADGRHLWNSGICVCRTDVLARAVALHQPALGDLLRRLGGRHPGDLPAEELAAWMRALPPISLDYGVLEHLERALVVEAALAWDDVGGWEALRRLHPQDGQGNVVLGKAVLSQTADTVVYGSAQGRLVVTHGVRDLIVVDTPDSILIAGRDALPDLKVALRQVRASGFAEHLDGLAPEAEQLQAAAEADPPGASAPAPAGGPRPVEGPGLHAPAASHTVDKPWGQETWWAHTARYVGKRIDVRAGHALSLQLHERKHETLYVLQGEVRLRLGGDERCVGPGHVAVVPPGTVHRIEALTDAVLFEVSTPELDDVVRLEDRYGRAPARAGAAESAAGR
jgi:mannose-1-phosphate guanylyltransferase